MNEAQIKEAVIELLYTLQERNFLDLYVLDTISRLFSIDTLELCEANGITYNEE
jgi:hypothetical protein